jgi:hypothetical protein
MAQSIAKFTPTEAGHKQAWLSSAWWDTLLIIGPAFLSSVVVLLFKQPIEDCPDLPLWAWVTFVLCIDVAHVYATLFRTYFRASTFEHNSTLLTLIPLSCWVIGALVYSIKALLFWRLLAYLAVFHFVRQQFGFIMLYSRKEPQPVRSFKWLDQLAIYMAAMYPLMFWHTNLPRNFSWFVEGDFIKNLPHQCVDAAFIVYVAVAAAYCVKELALFLKHRFFNVPKNLMLIGTALSWWVGIISVNSDLAFTMTNVVSHGIPYMALVWLYHHKDNDEQSRQEAGSPNYFSRINGRVMSNVLIFVLCLIGLAYLEEGLWAGLIWREHLSVFRPFANLPAITETAMLAILVPLLSLPQSTHYVLDGFIWRVKDKTSTWSADI